MNRKLLFLVATLSTAAAHAAPPEQALSAAAEDFIRAGAKTALGACDIIARKCGEESFQTLEKGFGESNEERRNWRKMQLRSLSLTALYPLQDPTRFYIETLKIDGAGWPIPHGLAIGMPQEDVSKRLGPPNRKDGKCEVYFSDTQIASAMLCFQSRRLSSISWEYFID
ncbi:MAG: hypothetical protein REI12_08985 [Pedobacter sp.]|nr:hypothetical protein [Pedobacter sp.]